jgi:hypothetical protein
MISKQFCRIDNLIIEKIRGGLKVGPITRFEKENKIKLDINKVPYISLGSRVKDNKFVSYLVGSQHIEKFEDLPIVYPSENFGKKNGQNLEYFLNFK